MELRELAAAAAGKFFSSLSALARGMAFLSLECSAGFFSVGLVEVGLLVGGDGVMGEGWRGMLRGMVN